MGKTLLGGLTMHPLAVFPVVWCVCVCLQKK